MKTNAALSCRVYELLLTAYPSEFRNEYGSLMAQLFRDRYRDEAKKKQKLAIAGYWFAVLNDLIVTACKEHGQNFRKGDQFMNNLRKDLLAVAGSAAIIFAAFGILRYGISNDVASILVFGKTLDAVATTGIIGNIIVFLLVKLTKWDSLRIAFWTFLIVHVVPLILLLMLGGRIDPQFRFAPILIAYVVSFLFWMGLHWAWHSTTSNVLEKS